MSHQDGSIESRQKSLKHTPEQAFLLRGQREFARSRCIPKLLAEVFGRASPRTWLAVP